MSTARILIKQGTTTYRFMRFETSSDGSLLAFLDRDPRSHRGGMETNEHGIFVPENIQSDEPLPSAKFSIHTTGQVHRYTGRVRKATIHIEPLHLLTKLAAIGFVSIPRPNRLDLFDEEKNRHDVAAILEIPEHISERITFVMELGPKPQQPTSFGVSLDYEIYSAVVRVVPAGPFPPELAEHFIHATPSGQFEKKQIDKANAELGFYQSLHGSGPIVFRDDNGGAYVVMAAVPMAKTPKLTMTFNRPDLYVEIIAFEENREPTHKVRFWICDKGGRNKKDDLRPHIKSIVLDARL